MTKSNNQGPAWEFIVGDCLSLPYPDNHFDLVFGSPPYESQRHYGDVNFNLRGDDWVDWATDRFMEHLRVCQGLVAWVVEGVTEDFAYSATPFRLMVSIQERGARLRKPSVYHRHGIPGTGGPDWLRNDWEPIICATKAGKLPWSSPASAIGVKPKYKSPRTATNRGKDGVRKSVIYNDPEFVNPGNVIHGLVGKGHLGWVDAHRNEAPFPQWLAEFHVRCFCPPGGLVLDPFCGSGTTLAAAVKYGRRAIGCDIRQCQIKLSETRMMGLTVAERNSGQRLLC